MAFDQTGLTFGAYAAGEDLSNAQYTAVKISSSKTIVACDTAGEVAFGVLYNKPASGVAATVIRSGIVKMVIGTGGLTSGTQWMVAADGTAVTATGTGKYPMGYVVAGGNAGEIASVSIGDGVGQLN